MKKALIILATGLIGFSASAQVDVLKEAERAMKGGKPYTEVLTIVTPAFTNAETKDQAQTYFIPGKAGFNQYDQLFGKRQLNMLPEGDEIVMATALLGGYDNYIKALPLDTVVDAKGKVKTKYSKDILKAIGGHYNDFSTAGIDFFNAKDFQNAYKSWDIFCKLTENADFYGIKPESDEIVSNMMFNRALAAWQAENYPAAVNSFRDAIKHGYDKSEAYKYGMSVATLAEDNDALIEFATLGNKLFGSEDPEYINNIINYYLKTEKYDEAIKYLEDAIAEKPDYAQYYALEGIIYDNKEDLDKAAELYKKAISLDSENALGNFYLGRAIALKASKLEDAYNGDQMKYVEYKDKNISPLYKDAVSYLEKAYTLDKGNRDEILRLLDLIYYQLDDAAGQESVKNRKLDD